MYNLIFEQSSYDLHLTKLLSHLVEPKREVEDFEIFHVNRRFFNGERAVKMLEDILGISTGGSQVYKYGYQNNHAVGVEGARQAPYRRD